MVDMYVKRSELKLISDMCINIIKSENFSSSSKTIAKNLIKKVDKRLYNTTSLINNYVQV